jgi:hypothetical protein
VSRSGATVRQPAPTPAAVAEQAARRPGSALDSGTRTHFEARYGHDFGRVRIHLDDAATRQLNAVAFTVRNDIFVSPQEWHAGGAATRAILAHELAHVVQQSPAPAGSRRNAIGAASAAIESEAESAAGQALAGRVVAPEAFSATAPLPAFLIRRPPSSTALQNANQLEWEHELDTADRDGSQARFYESLDDADQAELDETDAARGKPGPYDDSLDLTAPPSSRKLNPQKKAPEPAAPAKAPDVPRPKSPSREEEPPTAPADAVAKSRQRVESFTNDASDRLDAVKKAHAQKIAETQSAVHKEIESAPTGEAGAGAAESAGGAQTAPGASPGMSEEERAAKQRAAQIAQELDVARSEAVDAIKNGRKSATKLLYGSAAAAKANLTKRVDTQRKLFDDACTKLDSDFKADLAKERDEFQKDYEKRKKDSADRTQKSVDATNDLFSKHRPNIEKAVTDGIEDADKARLKHRQNLKDQYDKDKAQVDKIRDEERSKFGYSDRDIDQRVAVRMVAEKTKYKMDEQLPEAQGGIDELFEDFPKNITEGGTKALEGYDKEQPGIVKDLQSMGETTALNIETHAQAETSELNELEKAVATEIKTVRETGLARFDSIKQQSNDAVDKSLKQSVGTLLKTEKDVLKRVEPIGKETARMLREDEDTPEPHEAEEVVESLKKYFKQAGEYSAREMGADADKASKGFWRMVQEASSSAAKEVTDENKRVADIKQRAGNTLTAIKDQRAKDMKESYEDLDTTLSNQDKDLAKQFADLVKQFKDKIADSIQKMDAKVADATKEGIQKNQEAIGKVRDSMREQAEDAAWQYDHPIKAALRDIAYIILGILAGLLVALVIIVVAIVAFKLAVIGLVALGISATVATVIVAVVFIAAAVGGVYVAFKRRRLKGESVGGALLGALGDLTGVTEIVHAFTNPYDTPFERGYNFGKGLGTLAGLIFGGRVAKGVDKIFVQSVPWVVSRLATEEAATATRVAMQKFVNPKLIDRGWATRPLRTKVAQWFGSTPEGKGLSSLAEASAEAAKPPAVSAPKLETPKLEGPPEVTGQGAVGEAGGGAPQPAVVDAPKLKPSELPAPADLAPVEGTQPAAAKPKLAEPASDKGVPVDDPAPSAELPKRDLPSDVPEPPKVESKLKAMKNPPAEDAQAPAANDAESAAKVEAVNDDTAAAQNQELAARPKPKAPKGAGGAGKSEPAPAKPGTAKAGPAVGGPKGPQPGKGAGAAPERGPGTPEELFGPGDFKPEELEAAVSEENISAKPGVRVPVSKGGEPAQVLEVGAGPKPTNKGIPEDPNLIRVTETDFNPSRPGVDFLDGSKPIPPEHVGKYQTVMINNPRGYQPNVPELGRALKPGGRIIIQGKARGIPGQRGINPDFQKVIDLPEPPGFKKIIDLEPQPPGSENPNQILGGPFHRTTGEPVNYPNARVIFEKLPETVEPPSGGTPGPGRPPGDVPPEPAPVSQARPVEVEQPVELKAANDNVEFQEQELKLASGDRPRAMASGPAGPKGPGGGKTGPGPSKPKLVPSNPPAGSKGVTPPGPTGPVKPPTAPGKSPSGAKVIDFPQGGRRGFEERALREEVSAEFNRLSNVLDLSEEAAESPTVREEMNYMGAEHENQPLFRGGVRERVPETEIHGASDAHHVVEKRGGNLVMDVLREMADAEGIPYETDPANGVPLPSFRGREPGTQVGLTGHGSLHTGKYQENVLGEILKQDPLKSTRSILEDIGRMNDEARAAIKSELKTMRKLPRPLTPEQDARLGVLERAQRGPLTKRKLEAVGLVEEGENLLARFGIRTDGLDLEGAFNEIAQLLREGRFKH